MEGGRVRGDSDLRKSGALSPNAAVMADDGGGGEVVAVDLAQQVVVHVRLPRHLRSHLQPKGFFFFRDFFWK